MTVARTMVAGSAACLSACVAAAPAAVAVRDLAVADMPVTVDGRAFVASIAPGANGIALTNVGAVAVPGGSVRVTAPGLMRDEGIMAKQAAEQACTGQGGAFQPQAIGRYAAQDVWVFDGACA